MRRFDRFLAIDWSGARGKWQGGIALAMARPGRAPPRLIERERGWGRIEVLEYLESLEGDWLVGMDLGISLPFADCGAFFPGWERSPPDARALWALVDSVCQADPHLEAGSFVDHPVASRYFRRPRLGAGDRFACDGAAHGKGRLRLTERAQEALGCRPCSNFNLVGAAQVGKASLTGMRLLHRLSPRWAVWPIDPLPARGPVVVEIYTALAAIAAGRRSASSKLRSGEELDAALARLGSRPVGLAGPISDHRSDALLAAAWLRSAARRGDLWNPPGMSEAIACTEGWTFGAL